MAGFGSVLGGLGGGAIGSAIVRLQLDATAYQAQLKAAQGQTVASTNTMASGFGKFSQAAQTGMLIGGAALVAFAASSVKAFQEAEQVMAGTEAVLKSTGGQAGVTAEEIAHLSDSLSDMAGADDEAVQSSINLLLTFRRIADEEGAANTFERTERAILDMATAMNHGAIPTMETLKTTTIQVGKAVNDPIKGLTNLARVGVQFTESQQATIRALVESGDLMGAQGVILTELEKQFGGAAEAAGGTFAGALGDLSREFGNIQEQVGALLVPILLDAAKAFTGMLEGLQPLLSLIEKASPIFRVFGEAIGYIVSPISKLISLTSGLESGIVDEAAAAREGAVANTGLAAAVEESAGVVEDATKTQEEYEAAANATALAIRNQTDALIAQHEAYLTLADPIFAVISALNSDSEAEARLAAARRVLDRLTEQGAQGTRRYREAQDEVAAAALEATQAHEGLAANVRALNQQVDSGIVSFQDAKIRLREMGKAAGLSRPEIQGLVDELREGVREAGRFGEAGWAGGAAFVSGLIAAINGMAAQAYQAAYELGAKAELGLRESLQTRSPSKVTHRIGVNFVEGLIEGLESEDEALVKAATRAIEAMTKAVQRELDKLTREFEKQISKLEGQLSRVQSQASSLRGAVTGGFSSFLDIPGGLMEFGRGLQQQELEAAQAQLEVAKESKNTAEVERLEELIRAIQEKVFVPGGAQIGQAVAQQVAGATQFAAALTAAQSQGLSQEVLAQFAGQGPEGLPFLQGILQGGPDMIAQINAAFETIAGLAGDTAKGLSEAFFGERIDDLRDHLKDVRTELREQTRMFELMLRLLDNPERLLRRLEEIRDVIGNITVEVDGQALGNSVHSELVRRNRRSGSLQLT